ncbi:hypothetical protein [Mycobacterium sp. IS-1742]|uniref:hypothetical protein n=1 Tax=Mycobacterium sp. IS-1742 TaxID=1772285 RepID=UPI0012F78CD3|nr:hypothetical protein [Mycobacterium sp. IS-1742]
MRAFRTVYGSHPLHLLTLIAGFALFGYTVATIGLAALWNPRTWWQSIVVWFAAAVILHDLVLFPLYALVDRILTLSQRISAPVPALNHLRVPALGAALTFVVFSPGILRQGAPAYTAATGQTQEPYLGRWLLLVAAMFALSAAAYAVRLGRTRRATARPTSRAPGARPDAGPSSSTPPPRPAQPHSPPPPTPT